MKKLYTSAIIILIAVGKISAQNEYLQHNPQWVVINGNGVFYPCISYDSTHYFLNGDSIINSLTYKQLWKCGHTWYSWQSPNPNPGCGGQMTYCDTVATGFLRSQGLQMYYIPSGDTTEQLLYDFNLNVGDSLPVTYTYCCPGGETVTAIDSIYTPYGYRKRFSVNNNIQYCLVEGIGSFYGLIEPWGPQLDVSHNLYCYGLNDTAWYPGQGPACDVMTSILPKVQNEITLELVPNPAGENVEFIANGISIESITVYDVFGRVVKQEETNTKIFVGDLPAGVYTCVITAGEMRVSKNLVVE